MKDRFGVRKVFFIDSGFNVPMPHAKELCRTLIEEDLKVRWNSYLAPVPDACDEEVLSLMKQAGSGLLIVKGIAGESPDDGPLDARLEPLNDICQRCDAAGLSYVISQNFGEPGETAETVETKLEFLKGIRPALANLRVGFRVRPGTRAAQAALAEGMINESDLIKSTFYLDGSVRDWIVERLQAEVDANPRWNLL